MQYIPLKEIGHANCPLRFIAKCMESLEETVTTTLQVEIEIKSVILNVIQELPMKAQDI